MSSRDALSLLVAQRVQHAVMGMHRGQPILLQLVLHYLYEFLHALLVVVPVADNLCNVSIET